MAENTKIEWAHHTFNPWIGCTKVSPGCDGCYAERDTPVRVLRKQGKETFGPHGQRHHTAPSTWAQPLRWNAEAERLGVPQTVFCASLADVFDNGVPSAWRGELGGLILRTRHLIWLLLTKRIGNAKAMLAEMFPDGVPPNVRIGASITSQPEADRDIPKLLSLGLPNFLSMEPLLGPVDLTHIDVDGDSELNALKPDTWEEAIAQWRDTDSDWVEQFEDWFGVTLSDGLTGPMHAGIDRVIVGGESGPSARPMHPDWARSLRDQCQAAGVPFLFKQWGEWTEFEPELERTIDAGTPEGRRLAAECEGFISLQGEFVPDMGYASTDDPYRGIVRPGKKAAGRRLDGRTWDEVPS